MLKGYIAKVRSKAENMLSKNALVVKTGPTLDVIKTTNISATFQAVVF